jgi:hypothetical protein
VIARLVALAAAVLAVAACGGGSDDDAAATRAGGRCAAASASLVNTIAGSLQVEADLRHVRLVKSLDYRNVWFVSAEVVYEGFEDGAVATWATSVPAGGSAVYSLETNALQATSWPPAVSADEPLSVDDDGARESRRCAGRAAS